MFASLAGGVVDLPGLDDEAQRYYRDVYDHLIRLADLIDGYRDLLSGATDAYLSVTSNQLNVVMKQLAIISTVFLPLSFLTGFFGQNFTFLTSNIGSWETFWFAGVGSEVVVVASMMALFRARGWLGRTGSRAPPGGEVRPTRTPTVRGVTAWNFADVWEVVAAERADLPAIDQGATHLTWKAFDRRADALAATLAGLATGAQARVAQYLYNGPAYLESVFAAFKAGLVPVNTNYRYAADELVYLWDDADVEVVIFDPDLEARVASVRHRLPRCAGLDPGGRDRAAPRMGDGLRGRGGGRRSRARCGHRGGAAATICCSSTPVGPPACPRA